MGTLDIIREAARQEAAQDADFYKNFIYYFELRIPSQAASAPNADVYIFPLALNPESYVLEEPFALEKTFTQGGGLYVEENGIVERMIRLRGTTGFKPRKLKGGGATQALLAMSPEKKSYGRRLLAFVFDKLSGQRHFQYLQDVVFRTYADYKRDPATAEETQLIFHNPKDREHWLVAPEKFILERSGRSPLYRYSIDLLVLDTAEDIDADFSEDKSLLDEFKDAVRTIKSAIDLASGAVNDLTAIADEVSRFVKDIGKIIDSVSTFIDAAGDFVEGVVDLIETPYALIESVGGMVDSALDLVETTEDAFDDIQKLPDRIKEKLSHIRDAMDLAGTHPEVYERPVDKQLRDFQDRMELQLSASLDERTTAEEASPPQTIAAYDALGTTMTPGDVESAKADSSVGRTVGGYTGATEVPIGQGDTMANLAARYLGDARLWQEIAVLNGLQPPFIDWQAGSDLGGEETPLHGTLGLGKKILIPNYSKPPQTIPLLPVLGVTPEKSVEAHLLGTDFAMEAVSGSPGRELYDFVVDVEGGSLDAKHVSGVDNIKQAYIMRIGIEKGTDTMYHRLGMRRTIGLKLIPVDLETARFNLTECIRQDPRTGSVRHISFEQEDDAAIANMDVELRGFVRPTNVKVTV
jgi:hypothetical protein